MDMEVLHRKKEKIPKAMREQVWLQNLGKVYEHTCYVPWCENIITVFDFQVGHDQPESKGGALELYNLKPICSRCNSSMSDNYTIQEWSSSITNKKRWYRKILCC
jgi:5-methylcytosine-specific restriction endonuclease McrA